MRIFASGSLCLRQLGLFALLFIFNLGLLWPLLADGASLPKTPAASGKKQEMERLIEGAKAEGKVIWWDVMKPEEAAQVITGFQAKYPFIKVEHTRIHDSDSRERIFRELLAGKVNVDIFMLNGEVIPDFKKAGLLEKYDWTRAFDVPPELLENDQLFIAAGASMKGVGYNTNLVKKQDVPKRWEDLLDPKWNGKLVVDTRPKPFVHLMPGWGEERVLEYLKKLAAGKPKYRRGQTESIELMAAGDFPMIAGTFRHSILMSVQKGAPVNIALLDVIPVNLDKMGIARNCPHPNASKLLLGWLASKEGQSYYDKVTDRGLPLPGYDTDAARDAKGKKISLFTDDWVDREAELLGKALKALGRE
jgi:iron(III) transport system substrate-binding protein